MNKVICIVGPTASGKTSLSVKLAKALNGEIISADSMQIYKKLSIGTAKVTEEEKEGIAHHLVDFVEPTENFSVADFKKLCYEKIDDIISRGKLPIIVGGTGLYMSSVILNMNFEKEDEEKNKEYREYLYKLAEEKSKDYVYEMLKEIDYDSYVSIHKNNFKRVVRALELARNGKLKSEHMQDEKARIAVDNNKNMKYDFKLFCLKMDKTLLDERINKRVDLMVKDGLLDEAKFVYNLENGTVKQAVGYKEFFGYFEGNKTLEEAVEEVKLRTRQYAKRQMTWFKKMNNVYYLDALKSKEDLINEIRRVVYEKDCKREINKF